MRLSPQEIDKLIIPQIGRLALQRLATGIRLNVPETIGLLVYRILELARTGKYSVAQLMSIGKQFLGKKHVIPGIETIVDQVQIEATFPDGTKLVTIHEPICVEDIDLEFTFQGSFLPVPNSSLFHPHFEEGLIPGEVVVLFDPIHLNKGRTVTILSVKNSSDRPIQAEHVRIRVRLLSSEADAWCSPAGTSVRFEPGQSKVISLISIAGNKVIRGGNSLCDGPYNDSEANINEIMKRVLSNGFGHESESDERASKRNRIEDGFIIPRKQYAAMYGPTTGDIVRLADSDLYIRIEKDYCIYGDECKFGGGKTIREGMGQATGVPTDKQLDTVITNAIIIDHSGIFKADIGIKNGMIIGIGKAGNPDVMEGVHSNLMVGVNTEVIAGEGLLLTAGGIDSHIHFICPQICDVAVSAGLTTLIGGGTGPASGTTATTCTPSPNHMKMMLQSTDEIPINFGFTGKGNTSSSEGLKEIVEAGAIGLKLHEDWGTTPSAIDACLSVADEEDVQVTIHTDTLNESCCVEGTLAAMKGRTIHTYHSEGAGGGHAPDIITVCSQKNVIPSSTNPTRPLTCNTIDEHLDMLMVCHHLDAAIQEDVAFAESRIRKETIAAEDILHDLGAISIVSSDSQAMGRVGEVITRTWQTADKMKKQIGQLPEDEMTDRSFPQALENGRVIKTDNYRVRRYVSKYTINPAIAHGVSNIVGSVEISKLADLVLWKPSYFGVKPEIVIKGGQIAWSQMGDANASIPTPEPVYARPMYAARGNAAAGCSIAFVSKKSIQTGTITTYGLKKRVYPVSGTRSIGKSDMILNDAMPTIQVDPETYKVSIDGVIAQTSEATSLPMAQRYYLF